jgi:hypothetical protein
MSRYTEYPRASERVKNLDPICEKDIKAMRNFFKSGLMGVVAALCLSVASTSAFAALGSSPMTGANNHVAASQMLSAHVMAQASASAAAQNPAYSVNNVTLDSGTVVREFVATSTNEVFAVSWKGPRLPNFKDILGTYAPRYLTPTGADVVKSGGLGQRSLSASDLVVQSLGRLGQFSGYAYLPSAVPAGVSLSELQ